MPDRLSALVWLEQITQKCNISHGRGNYWLLLHVWQTHQLFYFISPHMHICKHSMKNNVVWKHANEFQPKGECEVMSVCLSGDKVVVFVSCFSLWESYCLKAAQSDSAGSWGSILVEVTCETGPASASLLLLLSFWSSYSCCCFPPVDLQHANKGWL